MNQDKEIVRDDKQVIEKIKSLAKGVSPDISRQMVLVHMFDSMGENKSLEEVLLAFCRYGNEIPDILVNSGISSILSEIYQNFSIQLDSKIQGVVGVKDENTYIFDFLISKLPELYAKGFIKTRPIDDIMNPKGILPLMMRELHKNKELVKEKIDNTFLVMRGTTMSGNDIESVQKAYSDNFEENLKKVANIFENSDINHFYSVIKQLESVLGDNGDNMLPSNMVQDSVPERWVEDMSYLMKSLLSHQSKQGEKIEKIFTTIKEGNALPAPEDIIDADLVDPTEEITAAVKETLTHFFETSNEEGDEEGEEDEKLSIILEALEKNKDSSFKEEIIELLKTKNEGQENEDEVLKKLTNLTETIHSLSSDTAKDTGIDKKELDDYFEKILEKISKMISINPVATEGGHQEADDSILKEVSKVKDLVSEGATAINEEIASLKKVIQEATEEEAIEGTEDKNDDYEDVNFIELFENLSKKVTGLESKMNLISETMLSVQSMIKQEVEESSKIRKELNIKGSKKEKVPQKNTQKSKGWFGKKSEKPETENETLQDFNEDVLDEL